ncbi:protein DBF4 homolog B [Hyperolius riggenbachi]|uniref:protein DBF4 homolog B n=1 Tax=Hyperolius riggenbachi TaxID=752182 RepID=UPI0035A3A7B1
MAALIPAPSDAMAALSPSPSGQHTPPERRQTLDRRKSITFKGKSFYLDLPHNKHTQLLTKAICSLGGVIEGFLSRDVHYVVTRSSKALDGSSEGLASDKKGGRGKRQATENVEPPLCRGKQLLKKAIQNQECSSVLANARSWGVSIVHVNEVLACMERSTVGAKSAEVRVGARKPVKVAKLKIPFLKIEDQSRKYRPIHCCFSSFPEVSFTSSDGSPFETNCTKNSTHKEKRPGDQKDDGERSQEPVAKKKSGFCECCKVTYTRLSEHLISQQHRRFALNISNYKVIDDVASKLICDLMELPHGFKPSLEKGACDAPSTVKELDVPPAEEAQKQGASKRLSEDYGTSAPVGEGLFPIAEEDHEGTKTTMISAGGLPVKNIPLRLQEESMANVTGGREENEDRPPCAEYINGERTHSKEPMEVTCDVSVTSHVGVVTEVSWYTEEAGLTSVYTVQSLVIPTDEQHTELSVADAIAKLNPPMLLSPLRDPLDVLVSEGLGEAHNAQRLEDSLPGMHTHEQIISANGTHYSKLSLGQATGLKIGDLCQGLFAESSGGNLHTTHLLDAQVQVPTGSAIAEEMPEVPLNTTRLHEQMLLFDTQRRTVFNAPDCLHSDMSITFPQLNMSSSCERLAETPLVMLSTSSVVSRTITEDLPQPYVVPSCQDAAEPPVVRPSTLHAYEAITDEPLCQSPEDTPMVLSNTTLVKEANKETLEKVYKAPVCQGPADTQVVMSSIPLTNDTITEELTLPNLKPLCESQANTPVEMHSVATLSNKANLEELMDLQNDADPGRGKRKHCFSPCNPPAKKSPYQYEPMPWNMLLFHKLPDSELQLAAHGFLSLTEGESNCKRKDGTISHSRIHFNPKLIQYDGSSESDWDSELLSQQQCEKKKTTQYRDLCTAQINLDESCYGRHLCSVLTHGQILGSPSTAQTVTLAQTACDMYLTGEAS